MNDTENKNRAVESERGPFHLSQLRGAQSIVFTKAPYLLSAASVAGSKEAQGPLGKCFDLTNEDDLFGAETWEEAESNMQKEACVKNGTDIYDYMTSLAVQAQPGCEGLTFLPYLNGEKTPISDENARGVLFGLSYRHGINEIARSVMEGITFAMRDSVEICREMGHSVTEIRANGGGAKSELWLQMQADIYKSQVVTMNVEEGPAAGAAILAAVGAGHFATVEEGCDAWLKVTRTIEPDMHNAAIYDECYARYKALYPALKESFRLQAELVNRLA